MKITATPTLHDGIRLTGAAYRLMTGTAGPNDLQTLVDYRRGNDRELANAARLFLDLFNGADDSAPGNVVSITGNQVRHDLAMAARSMDAARDPRRSYDPLGDGPECA